MNRAQRDALAKAAVENGTCPAGHPDGTGCGCWDGLDEDLLDDEPDDGLVLVAGVLYDAETLEEHA